MVKIKEELINVYKNISSKKNISEKINIDKLILSFEEMIEKLDEESITESKISKANKINDEFENTTMYKIIKKKYSFKEYKNEILEKIKKEKENNEKEESLQYLNIDETTLNCINEEEKNKLSILGEEIKRNILKYFENEKNKIFESEDLNIIIEIKNNYDNIVKYNVLNIQLNIISSFKDKIKTNEVEHFLIKRIEQLKNEKKRLKNTLKLKYYTLNEIN